MTGQEILASEERAAAGLVWVAHPSVRLSCFFFCSRHTKHPLEEGTVASCLFRVGMINAFIPPLCVFC